ncbi:hypothetical protein CVT25_007247 [Psilocybe cyanescens]|uniref:Uncharacterized protein n=1 Tax=Psilocybe cyanescens TaxID=93625 RepID=A0A409WVC0_PSICY|nr:hypothetical protein CVT25_007247 [Psilocybe cyanescens]
MFVSILSVPVMISPHRFDQRTSNRGIGSGRRSSVRYTPNSHFYPNGQKPSDAFIIDDAQYDYLPSHLKFLPHISFCTQFLPANLIYIVGTSGKMHIGLEKERFLTSTSIAGF